MTAQISLITAVTSRQMSVASGVLGWATDEYHALNKTLAYLDAEVYDADMQGEIAPPESIEYGFGMEWTSQGASPDGGIYCDTEFRMPLFSGLIDNSGSSTTVDPRIHADIAVYRLDDSGMPAHLVGDSRASTRLRRLKLFAEIGFDGTSSLDVELIDSAFQGLIDWRGQLPQSAPSLALLQSPTYHAELLASLLSGLPHSGDPTSPILRVLELLKITSKFDPPGGPDPPGYGWDADTNAAQAFAADPVNYVRTLIENGEIDTAAAKAMLDDLLEWLKPDRTVATPGSSSSASSGGGGGAPASGGASSGGGATPTPDPPGTTTGNSPTITDLDLNIHVTTANTCSNCGFENDDGTPICGFCETAAPTASSKCVELTLGDCGIAASVIIDDDGRISAGLDLPLWGVAQIGLNVQPMYEKQDGTKSVAALVEITPQLPECGLGVVTISASYDPDDSTPFELGFVTEKTPLLAWSGSSFSINPRPAAPDPGFYSDAFLDSILTLGSQIIIDGFGNFVIEEFVLPNLSNSMRSAVSTLLEDIEVAEIDANGSTRMTSLLPLILDPVSHLRQSDVWGDDASGTEFRAGKIINSTGPLIDACTGGSISLTADGFEMSLGSDLTLTVERDGGSTAQRLNVTLATLPAGISFGSSNGANLVGTVALNIGTGPPPRLSGTAVSFTLANQNTSQFSLNNIGAGFTIDGSGSLGISLVVNSTSLEMYPNFVGIGALIDLFLDDLAGNLLARILNAGLEALHDDGHTNIAIAISNIAAAANIHGPVSTCVCPSTCTYAGGFDGTLIGDMIDDLNAWRSSYMINTIRQLGIEIVAALPSGTLSSLGTLVYNPTAQTLTWTLPIVDGPTLSLTLLTNPSLELNLNVDFDNVVEIMTGAHLDAVLSVDVPFSTPNDFTINLGLHVDSVLVSFGPLGLQPSLNLGYGPSGFIVSAATTSWDGSTPASGPADAMSFWVKSNPFDHGTPSLAALAKAALIEAINFLLGIDEIDEWLRSSLYDGGDGGLDEVTKPGTILANLNFIENHVSLPQYCVHNDFENNLTLFITTPLQTLLGAIFGAIGDIQIYQSPYDADFQFEINLVRKDVGCVSDWGVNFDFVQIPLPDIGGLNFEFVTQAKETLDAWAHTETGGVCDSADWATGFSIYFLTKNGSTFSPKLSVEVGGVEIRIWKEQGPILQKFLTLNQVGLALAFDFDYDFTTSTSSFAGGAQITLDDFGIELGGGGDDSTNPMASSLMSGGGEGEQKVNPTFDLALSYYSNGTGHTHFSLTDGELERWFKINKKFGPLEIDQIGVEIYQDGQDNWMVGFLVDGRAEISGFLCEVDDLRLSLRLTEPWETDYWAYDLAGLALSYSGPGGLSIVGALRKAVMPVYDNGNPVIDNGIPVTYIEYQGLCSIKASSFGLSAVGAFGRVNDGANQYVSCFVVAAVDATLGGPPFFFVTGLLGGLGLNRQLSIPSINQLDDQIFLMAMDSSALCANPMGVLDSIRDQMPAEYGSFWFAIGVKFTTFKVLESKAVLYLKFGSNFSVGILGLSRMDLPSKDFSLGLIELAFHARYESEDNVFLAEAALTDASYLFTESCRLTGGFALGTWFNTGEFLLSIGGYNKHFVVPSHYPSVDRIGINWQPNSDTVIKAEGYFTICTSAVMFGGGFDVSWASGRAKASLWVNVDALIIFDPFYYNFEFGVGISASYKFPIWGWESFSISAIVKIEGPKMRGSANVKIGPFSTTISFGSTKQTALAAMNGFEFINKHVRQLPEDISGQNTGMPLDSKDASWAETVLSGSVAKGQVLSSERDPQGLTANDAWMVGAEFSLKFFSTFPLEKLFLHEYNTTAGTGRELQTIFREGIESLSIAPCFKTSFSTPSTLKLMITAAGGVVSAGVAIEPTVSLLPETIWRCDMVGGKPKAKSSVDEQVPLYTGSTIIFSSVLDPGNSGIIDLDGAIETCENPLPLPFNKTPTPIVSQVWRGGLNPAPSSPAVLRLVSSGAEILTGANRRTLLVAIDASVQTDEVDSARTAVLGRMQKGGSGVSGLRRRDLEPLEVGTR